MELAESLTHEPKCTGTLNRRTGQIEHTSTCPLHQNPRERLEQLRAVLRTQNISQGELAELQGLTSYIEPDDTELAEAAGIPETRERNTIMKDIIFTLTARVPDDTDPMDVRVALNRALDETEENSLFWGAWEIGAIELQR